MSASERILQSLKDIDSYTLNLESILLAPQNHELNCCAVSKSRSDVNISLWNCETYLSFIILLKILW